MTMKYASTRSTNREHAVSAAQAIKQGLAADGGLFMPQEIPALTMEEILSLKDKSYIDRAVRILKKFLTDYTEDELRRDCEAAYGESKFPGGAAPLVKVDDRIYSLELWHGPTCAFKDMALQLMPRLLCRALDKTGEKRDAMILVATSGDTGKAALEGYRDVERIKIKVFYPVDGVSRVQKLQMATQTGANVDVCAIRGNFDDAQTGVKKIFADASIAKTLDEKGVFLSSANSINWGRLAPQIVYYVSAYCDLLAQSAINPGDEIDVCVPTGNFGNIFAAYIAKRMGLPICRLICASNRNNILTDFLATGAYDRNRKFYTTMSPSMDILVSSNLERLLYLLSGDDKLIADLMKQLSENGEYEVPADMLEKLHELFWAGFCDDEGAKTAIGKVWKDDHYLCDTHTAVAWDVAQQYKQANPEHNAVVVLSTASPYKFPAAVLEGIGEKAEGDEFDVMEQLHKVTGVPVPKNLADLRSRAVRHRDVIDRGEMLDYVLGKAAAEK